MFPYHGALHTNVVLAIILLKSETLYFSDFNFILIVFLQWCIGTALVLTWNVVQNLRAYIYMEHVVDLHILLIQYDLKSNLI